MIQATDDPIRIEELLLVHDSITATLKDVEDARIAQPSPQASPEAPSPALSQTTAQSDVSTAEDDMPLKSVQAKLNGLRLHIPSPMSPGVRLEIGTESETDAEAEVDEAQSTPRADKGKGRAPPEPIVHERVLTPNRVIEDSEDEDGEEKKEYFDAEADEEDSGAKSPTDL